MAEEDKRSYLIVRPDGLVVHTRPITREEADLLHNAYYPIEDLSLRIRYLEEYGNVVDLGVYVDWLRLQDLLIYSKVVGIHGDLSEFKAKVSELLNRNDLSPEARQALEGLVREVEEFYREPVEPKPVEAPARYLTMPGEHLTFGPDGAARAEPRPEWYAYDVGDGEIPPDYIYGISVFDKEFWLWGQYEFVEAVVVRRDATDKEVLNAVLNDEAARGFLEACSDCFKDIIDEYEKEMKDKGYRDVVRKAKKILTLINVLNAGRHEEEDEEEGVPA